VAISFDIEGAVWARTSAGSAGEVAGRVVEEHVLAAGILALMRAVFLDVCQRLTVVSNCMPGSPHCQVASAIFARGLWPCKCVDVPAIANGLVENSVVANHGVHESSVTRTELLAF
jgi:hypothetical protein